jgi:hypothetical protein
MRWLACVIAFAIGFVTFVAAESVWRKLVRNVRRRPKCDDCDKGLGRSVYAQVTFHDLRSCVHLCFYHAEKRLTHIISGRSKDCPYHEPQEPPVSRAGVGTSWVGSVDEARISRRE